MMPGVFEFRWDAGHLVFLGAFLLVLLGVATTLLVAWRRSRRDLALDRTAALRWHADFEELPPSCRTCRHTLDGTTGDRTCTNAFECGHCDEHARIVHSGARTSAEPPASPGGLELPPERLYDRGHTCVDVLPDGGLRVGLDPLATRLVGTPETVELPSHGARLHRHPPAWRLGRRGLDFDILSPVDGTVRATGDGGDGWYVELEPAAGGTRCEHLLQGAEARVWMLREIERLQQLASSAGLGATLADGGALAADLGAQVDERLWRRLCDDLLLQV